MTSQEVPLLSLEQIEQLAGMVRSIQSQNGSDLEELLSERVEIQHTSIMNLYNLAAQEWTKKQKIIDNLCHFALTIMNSIQLLWEQHYKLQNQLKEAETTVQQLQRTLIITNDENDNFKETIEQTQMQMEALAEQRNKIQEYCRSLSCIELPQLHQETLPKQLSAVFESEELKHRQQVDRLLQQKLTEIESLKQQKQKLSEQYEQLKEEQELTRMEMELAEIAVQQALPFKNSYLMMVSQMSQVSAPPQDNQKREEKPDYPLQEEPRFIGPKSSNSLGEDLSDLCPLNSHLLHFQPPFEHSHYQEPQEDESSLIKMKTQEERKTSHCSPSPFRRKGEAQEELQNELESFEQSAIMQKHESVIIMQSSLDMTISSEGQERPKMSCSNRLELKSNRRQRPFQVPRVQEKEQIDVRRRKGVNRTIPNGVPIYMDSESSSSREGGALGRLFNLLSTKVVTNRIRKH